MVRIAEDLVYPANNHRLLSLGLRNYNINSLSNQKRVPVVNLTEMLHMLASKLWNFSQNWPIGSNSSKSSSILNTYLFLICPHLSHCRLSLDENAAGFSRDAFGRQSMSEKRHATLDAKNTDTYQRNKKIRYLSVFCHLWVQFLAIFIGFLAKRNLYFDLTEFVVSGKNERNRNKKVLT